MNEEKLKCDFLIIGAGIAGASAGYFLSNYGKVIVADMEQVAGYHTTGRSAAFFAKSYGNGPIRQLTAESEEFFLNPPDGFTEGPLMSKRGSIFIGREDQAHIMEELVKETCIPYISLDELQKRVPSVKDGYATSAATDDSCLDIDVHALHMGFLKGIRRNGGEIILKAPLENCDHHEGLWNCTIGKQRVEAKILINAAGAWGDHIAKIAGVKPIGLNPLRRTMVTVKDTGGLVDKNQPLVVDADEEFYYKPEGGGIMVSPCDETPHVACDVQPDEMDVAIAIDRLEQATKITVKRIEQKWAGLRTFSDDRTPVVGFDDQVKNFFWCVGQGGYGIQTSPSIGRMVADIINGDMAERAELAVHRFRSNNKSD